jgi:hypothetical protein
MKFQVGALLFAVGLMGLMIHTVAARQGERESKKVDTVVFELRTYHAKPGKMEALHARFRNHTCKLFEKHGMKIVGFWKPLDAKKAEETLVYLLAFPSKAAADTSWKAFRDDPDWKAVRAESEKDGPLVDKVESVYLSSTDYSPMK